MTGYALVSAGPVASTAGGSLTPAFGQATKSGNLLVAWMSSASSSASNPFSTAAPGWTLARSSGRAFNWTAIFYKADSVAGETAPAFSLAGANGTWFAQLGEFSGGATTAPLDQSGNLDTAFVAGGTAVTATAAAADAAGGNLLISSYESDGGAVGPGTLAAAGTDSAAAPVTMTIAADNPATAGNQFYVFAWGVCGSVLGTHADTASVTNSLNENNNTIALASFKPGAGITAGTVPDDRHHRRH